MKKRRGGGRLQSPGEDEAGRPIAGLGAEVVAGKHGELSVAESKRGRAGFREGAVEAFEH